MLEIGTRIGSIVVVGVTKERVNGRGCTYDVKCDCGKTIKCKSSFLHTAKMKYCGRKCHILLQEKWFRENRRKHDNEVRRGESTTPLYRRWMGMKERCRSLDDRNRKWYRDKGVGVCGAWKEYWPFAEWARANGFAQDLELDRIDGNKDYGPNNCRWVTKLFNLQHKSHDNKPCNCNRIPHKSTCPVGWRETANTKNALKREAKLKGEDYVQFRNSTRSGQEGFVFI